MTRFIRLRWLACLPVMLLAACTTMEPASVDSAPVAESAQHETLRSATALQERLDHVAGPLLLKNAAACKKQTRNLLGFSASNRYSYSEALSGAAQAALGLGEALQVTSVMSGSGAERVGLQRGDRLIAVGNKPMPQGKNAELEAPAVLAPFVIDQTSVKLTVQREGKNLNLSVPLTRACGFRVELGNTDNINLYADGRRILVTRGMIKFVRSDEELAYVIAKGMAHNLFGHTHRLGMTETVGDAINNLRQVRPDSGENIQNPKLKPMPQAMDAIADRLSLYLTARAGYAIEGAPEFWQRLATQHPATEPGSFSAAHPSTPQRLAAMAKAINEIRHTRVRKKVPKSPKKPAKADQES